MAWVKGKGLKKPKRPKKVQPAVHGQYRRPAGEMHAPRMSEQEEEVLRRRAERKEPLHPEPRAGTGTPRSERTFKCHLGRHDQRD